MNIIEELFNHAMFQRFGWALVHFVWQGAVVALLGGVGLRLLRNRSPNARYLLSCTVLALLGVLPVLTGWVIPVRPDEGPAIGFNAVAPAAPTMAEVERPAALPAPVRSEPFPAAGATADPLPKPLTSSPPWSQRVSVALRAVLPYVVGLWIVGVLALSLWRAAGWARVRQLKGSAATPVGESLRETFATLARRVGVAQPVRLMRSGLVKVPAVVGWFRPVVLLPVSAMTGLTEEQLRTILVHELAHIRRYDYLVNLLQSVVETLLFYHPCVWWISHRIRQERENCCDDIAAQTCGDRLIYARTLVTMEELKQTRTRLAVAANGGTLLSRVRRLLTAPSERSTRPARWLGGALTLLLALAIVIGVGLSCAGDEKAAFNSPTSQSLEKGKEEITKLTCRGKVLDAEGKPLPGAKVTAYRLGDDPQNRELVPVAKPITTGSDGAFSFALPQTDQDPGVVHIVASKPNLATDWANWSVFWDKDPEFIIRLRKGSPLGGVVVDEGGAPIAGAEVRTTLWIREPSDYRYIFGDPPLNWLLATTDVQGRFILDNIPPDATAGFLVSAPGQARIFTDDLRRGGTLGPYDAGQTDIRITLPPEARIEGRVVDKNTGKPLGGLRLMARPKRLQGFEAVSFVSGADGTFHLGNLRPGGWTVKLADADTGSVTVETEPGKTTSGVTIETSLPLESRIEGRVVDKNTGKPLGGLRLIATPRKIQGVKAIEFVSDADGTFQLDKLRPGAWIVQLADAETGSGSRAAAPILVETEPGKTTSRVTVECGPGGLLEVLVLDASNGKPISGARVHVERRYNDIGGALVAETDKDGLARLRVAPGAYLPSSATKQGYLDKHNLWRTIRIAEGETQRQTRYLSKPRQIRGLVRDPSGEAVPGAVVRLIPGGGETTKTDSRGKFEFSDSWSGDVPMLLVRELKRNLAAVVELEDGDGPVEITLAPAATFVGGVTDPGGKPIPHATCEVTMQRLGWPCTVAAPAKTNDRGRFEIKTVPTDSLYSLSATADGFGRTSAELLLRADDSGYLLVEPLVLLPRNLSISGTVVDGDGEPVENAVISFGQERRQPRHWTKMFRPAENAVIRMRAQGYKPSRWTKTDKHGKFTIEKICEGQVVLYVWRAVEGRIESCMCIRKSGEKDIRIVLGRSTSSRRAVPAEAGSRRRRPEQLQALPSSQGSPERDNSTASAPDTFTRVRDVREIIRFVLEQQHRNTEDEVAEWLTDLIRRNAGKRSEWQVNGGKLSAMLVWNGQLIVTTTKENHAKVLEIINNLCKNGLKRITLKARFIELSAADEARLREWLDKQLLPSKARKLPEKAAFHLALDTKTSAELLRRIPTFESATVLGAPRILSLSYGTVEFASAQEIPLNFTEPAKDDSYNFPSYRIGEFFKAHMYISPDGKSLFINAKPEVGKLVSNSPPVESRAYFECETFIPESHSLLIRMPYRRYRIVGVSKRGTARTRHEAEKVEIEWDADRKLIDPKETPQRYVYVLLSLTWPVGADESSF